MIDLKKKIREVPDWPKKGVSFKDITTLLQEPKFFKEVVDLIAKPLAKKKIDKIVGIDARGFLIAAPVAYKLKTGLVIVRNVAWLLRPIPSRLIKKNKTLNTILCESVLFLARF